MLLVVAKLSKSRVSSNVIVLSQVIAPVVWLAHELVHLRHQILRVVILNPVLLPLVLGSPGFIIEATAILVLVRLLSSLLGLFLGILASWVLHAIIGILVLFLVTWLAHCCLLALSELLLDVHNHLLLRHIVVVGVDNGINGFEVIHLVHGGWG